MVFGFEHRSRTIGTIRIVPMGAQLTLIEKLLDTLDASMQQTGDGQWEVGRLVLTPEYRSDVDTLRHCLYLALAYACAHAPVAQLHAACTHVLSRLYRRFGFKTFARDVSLCGAEKSYTLIRGGSPEVLKALSGPGAGARFHA